MFQSTSFVPLQEGCISSDQMAEHEGLVRWVVRQQWLGELSFVDALHEGRIGLWRALRRYDPTRGTAFSTYAVVAISRAVWSFHEGWQSVVRLLYPAVLQPLPSPLTPTTQSRWSTRPNYRRRSSRPSTSFHLACDRSWLPITVLTAAHPRPSPLSARPSGSVLLGRTSPPTPCNRSVVVGPSCPLLAVAPVAGAPQSKRLPRGPGPSTQSQSPSPQPG